MGPTAGQGSTLVMHGGEGVFRVDLESQLHTEESQPEVKLKSRVQVVRPSESKVVSLGGGLGTCSL